jgi:hypothetical protein
MDTYQKMAELQRNWTPPPELAGFGSREVQLSRAGIAIAVLAGALILGGLGAGIGLERVSSRQSAQQALLNEQGKEAEGTVTRLWRARDKEKRPMVAYQYQAAGATYAGSAKAPLRIWKTLAVGSPLAVRFLPSDPALNHPIGWAASTLPLWLPFLAGALLAALGGFLVFGLRRQMALLSEGRPAPAVVTRYSNAQHGQKNIHYEFPLLGGSMAKGHSGPRRTLPAIGATLCVIYDRDNPRRNATYPMQMVRLVNAEKWLKK